MPKLPIVQVAAALSPLLCPTAAMAQLVFQPPDLRAPAVRQASPGVCTIGSGRQLTAVLPETNVGVTLQANPQLSIYVPRNNAQYGQLQVYEEGSDSALLTTAIDLPPSVAPGDFQYGPALTAVTLDDIELVPGIPYRWTITLVCNDSDRTSDVAVSGLVLRAGSDYIDRLEPNVQAALTMLSDLSVADQLSTYAEAGVWHELIANLTALAERDPSYAAMLANILTLQGLEAMPN